MQITAPNKDSPVPMPKPNAIVWTAYQQHRTGLYAYARSLTGDTHRAQDAVHDAVISAAQAQEPPRHPKAYLYRAVRNAAFKSLAQNGREHALHEVDLAGFITRHPDAPADEQLIDDERRDAVIASLESISTDEREVIVLHIFSGFRFREIATMLQTPMGTVTSRYRRGLDKLSQLLEESLHAH